MRWPTAPLDTLKSPNRYSFVGGPFGSELTTRDYVADGIPVIRGNNLSGPSKFHDDDYVYVGEKKAKALQSNLAYPGDLVFTQRGTLGQVGLIPADAKFEKYVISQSQMKLTVDENKANPLFLYYFFKMPGTIQQIVNRVSSSGVPHINLSVLKAFEVPAPDKDVQDSIVEFVRHYDDLIENNRRRIALLEQVARLLYEEWFVRFRFPGHEHAKFINGLPNGWSRKPASECIEIMSGGTPKTENAAYWDGDIPFYTPKDAESSVFVFDTEKHLTEQGLKACNSHLYPENSLMLTARGTVGKMNLTSQPMAMNQSCYALVARLPLSQEFLYFAMLAGVRELRSHAGGAVFDAIIRDTFRFISITEPNEGVVQDFTGIVQPYLKSIQNFQAQNRALQKAQDLLLPRLMSGEVEV